MNETEWSEQVDLADLLLASNSSLNTWDHPRAPRLLACEACRLIWDQFTDPRSRKAIEIAEQYADGKVTLKALTDAHKAARNAWRESRPRTPARWQCSTAALTARPRDIVSAMIQTVLSVGGGENNPWEDILFKMVHDVFDRRLFRSIAADPSWLTSTVVALAQQMYVSHDFSPMPILADALQDAGCDNADVLNHCRQPGEHCRGCWLVDLVLAKG